MHTKPSILTPSRLRPILLAMATGFGGLAAHAGTCNVTTPGAATCAIPAGVTSVNVVATGGGGGGGGASGGAGGAGGIVTATLTGVGGSTLNLYVGGGGGRSSGGGSSNVNAGTASQIIAGGGGGGGNGNGGNGGNGNGGNGGDGGNGFGGTGGIGGSGGFGGGNGRGGDGGVGNGGGGGGDGGIGIGGIGFGGGSGGSGFGGDGGGGGGYGGGGGGGGGGNGGGGGGSIGGVVTVASNGGAAGANGGDGSIVITWTDPVVTPPVTEPIPVTIPTTGKVDPGVTTTLTPKDLSSGQGPKMVACLTDALTPVFAPAAVAYLGQNADGSARYSIATSPAQTLSFYPLTATTDTGSGITLGSNNILTAATRCGTFTAEPALFNRGEFGAVVTAMGLSATINDQGIITIQSGSTIYVARPDYLVTAGTPGKPSLTQGGDGLYRFTDSAGNTQVLRPAFLQPDVLRTALVATLGAQFGSFVIQTDGSAVLTTRVNGTTQAAVLTPSLTLGTVSADHWADSVWGSGANWTYRVFSFPNATQGYASVRR